MIIYKLSYKEEMSDIFLIRHGKYQGVKEENPGSLTEEGKKECIKQTRDRINNLLDSTNGDFSKIKFAFIASPTHLYDNKLYGQRAKETTDFIKETIKQVLIERGVDKNKVDNFFLKQGKYKKRRKFSLNYQKLSRLLAEPNIFRRCPRFLKSMREEYGKEFLSQTFKYNGRGEDAKEEYPKADIPSVICRKVDMVIDKLKEWIKEYEEVTGIHICAFAVTHNEILTPYWQKIGNMESTFGYGEGIHFHSRANGELDISLTERESKDKNGEDR